MRPKYKIGQQVWWLGGYYVPCSGTITRAEQIDATVEHESEPGIYYQAKTWKYYIAETFGYWLEQQLYGTESEAIKDYEKITKI